MKITFQLNYHLKLIINNLLQITPTHLPSSFQNGITSHTSTIVNVYPQEEGNNSPPQPNYLQNNLPSNNEENDDYYEIHTENMNATENTPFIPIVNYSRDKIVDSDVQEGWERIQPDIIPNHGPFTDNKGLNMSTDSCQPEDFFNEMFDDRIFTIMVEETNNYACKKIHEILQGRDHFQQIDHHSYHQHARLGTWRDVNSSNIKIFIAHLLVMSSVHKTALHNYWSTKTLSRTPFFGQYIWRNKFQDILWNLHVCDTTNNPYLTILKFHNSFSIL